MCAHNPTVSNHSIQQLIRTYSTRLYPTTYADARRQQHSGAAPRLANDEDLALAAPRIYSYVEFSPVARSSSDNLSVLHRKLST